VRFRKFKRVANKNTSDLSVVTSRPYRHQNPRQPPGGEFHDQGETQPEAHGETFGSHLRVQIFCHFGLVPASQSDRRSG